MTQSFFINKKYLEQVKKEIRTYPSFRFVNNPNIIGDEVNIKIEGNVQDMNKFDKYLEYMQHTKITSQY